MWNLHHRRAKRMPTLWETVAHCAIRFLILMTHKKIREETVWEDLWVTSYINFGIVESSCQNLKLFWKKLCALNRINLMGRHVWTIPEVQWKEREEKGKNIDSSLLLILLLSKRPFCASLYRTYGKTKPNGIWRRKIKDICAKANVSGIYVSEYGNYDELRMIAKRTEH